jgi:hypothetical protein
MLIEVFILQNLVNNKENILTKDESFSTLATPTLLAGWNVPASHKRVADNYIIIKRLYKTQSLKSFILASEKQLLSKYMFMPLSQMSIQDVNKEILVLQQWSASENHILKQDADNLIQVRAKELRYILSSKYAMYSSEINNGFRALERYFEEITKFYNLPH